MEYFPSGETFVESHLNSYNTPYKFNAKELDDETGYYYYGARYYNPRTSLWLGTDALAGYDPIMNDEHYIDGEHNGGVYKSGNLNPYIYCYQSPVMYVDPNGKQVSVHKLQSAKDGYGSLYKRSYTLNIDGGKLTAYGVFEEINKNFTYYTRDNSYFERIKGNSSPHLSKGDELAIEGGPGYKTTSLSKSTADIIPSERIDSKNNVHTALLSTGVTVVDSKTDFKNQIFSMTFATWDGHVEASRITFTSKLEKNGLINFTINSESRSSNFFTDKAYRYGGGFKAQTKHWEDFLKRLSETTKGTNWQTSTTKISK